MGSLVSIVFTPRELAGRPQSHYVRIPHERVRLIPDRGIEGDAKGHPGIRQINLMCAEVLAKLKDEGFQTDPGQMGEQVVISGIPAESFVPGARLRIGEALLEVTIPRTGCERFETIQGRSKASVAGRLGVLAKVLEGGTIGLGDEVTLLQE